MLELYLDIFGRMFKIKLVVIGQQIEYTALSNFCIKYI